VKLYETARAFDGRWYAYRNPKRCRCCGTQSNLMERIREFPEAEEGWDTEKKAEAFIGKLERNGHGTSSSPN
jgi:hypothetical protein